jgi:hypothetical protein
MQPYKLSLQKLKKGGGNGGEEPPAKKRRIAMQSPTYPLQSSTHLQRLAVIPTFKEKVEELLDKFPGYDGGIYGQSIPELYKKEMEKLFDDISTYLTTQYAAELLNDKHSLYREKRDSHFGYDQISHWVRNRVFVHMTRNPQSVPFNDDNVFRVYVEALLQAFEMCKMFKTTEEERIAAAKAEEDKKRAAAKAKEDKIIADVAAAEARETARLKRKLEQKEKMRKKIKKMEETFLDDFAKSLKVRYFPEQAKWLPDFDMTLLEKFKEAKEQFIDEDEEVKDQFSSEQTILDRVREVTQHAVKTLLAPHGAILTLADMAVGGVSQVFDLRGTDGALMAWGSGNSIGGNYAKLVLQCSLDEKIENFVDFVDTTYHLPISTPETYATLNERLPVPFVRFVVRGGALSHINVKVSFK